MLAFFVLSIVLMFVDICPLLLFSSLSYRCNGAADHSCCRNMLVKRDVSNPIFFRLRYFIFSNRTSGLVHENTILCYEKRMKHGGSEIERSHAACIM